MLTFIALIFALAALGGLTLATLHFRQKPAPQWLAFTHLTLAAVGLVLFIVQVTTHGAAGLLSTALALFVIAALGGFMMLAFRLKQKPQPRPLIVVHGLVAVAAFLILVTHLS